jgi:hypothetical protein
VPDRPTAGAVEERAAPDVTVDGRRLRGAIPYGVESRDLGGWREVIEPGALRDARRDDLVATVDHAGVPLGRYPDTLTVEDRDDALHWSVDLPESRADVREALIRRDLRGCSWRMVVARDRWVGDVRHIEAIAELRDVSVVTTPAYPGAAAEFRSAPAPTTDQEATLPDNDQTTTGATATAEPEDRTGDDRGAEDRTAPPARAGLRVEDRAARTDAPVEARVLDAMRAVPRGEARDLIEASGAGSAAPITPPEFNSFLWDNLRPAAVVLASGVRVLTTDRRELRWPVITDDAAAEFYAELEPIAEDDPVLDEIVAVPRAIKALVRASSEAFDDSDPSLRAVLQQHLTAVLATRLDREMIRGAAAGTDGFNGLLNVTGAQVVNHAGGAPWDGILRALAALADANAPGPYAVLLHPRAAGALALAKDADGLPLPRPASIPEPLVTSALPLDAVAGTSPAVVYSVPQVAVVRRQDATVEVDRSREFEIDGVLVRGKLRATMVVPHAQAVAIVQDLPSPAPTA